MRWWTPASIGVAQIFAVAAHAQHTMDHPMPDSGAPPAVAWTLGAQVIAVGTIASPAVASRTLTEGYLSQPMLMGSLSALKNHVTLNGMLDFEGITLERGELDLGMHGEGYVDRRHPHTYLHELVATGSGATMGTNYSLAVGKGFVPFGTEDPMVRPFEKYPTNHHIAQIVERLLATVAVRRGPLLLEAARFNGDEPESPSDWPNTDRLWDSWAARATLMPRPELEMQASLARVESPELALSGGLDQRKVNVSVRYESVPAAQMPMDQGGEMDHDMELPSGTSDEWKHYALVEWGSSSDYDSERRVFTFATFLAEAEVRRGRVAFGACFERTERPEEERLANPFRTQRPANDFNILGRTRWDIVTARVSAIAWRSKRATVVPFLEVARQHATALERPAVFDPRGFYGSDSMWGLSAGITLSAGMLHRRTGQYGAAARSMSDMSMATTGGTTSMPGVSETKSSGGSGSQ